MAGARRVDARRALAAICVFVAAVGLWNVAHYPPGRGYDAKSHITYAEGLVPGGRLPPKGQGEYYTPPGYYAIAGSAVWIAEQLGVNDYSAPRAAMLLNVLFLLGTVLLVARIAAELFPGRERIALGAAAFVAFLPVAVEAEAMFHPDSLTLLLATLSLWLCIRTFAEPRYAVALGVVLGLSQLVRAYALWTVVAVLVALLLGRRWRSFLLAALLAAAIPAPWYVHQERVYGGDPIFPQPAPAQARNANGSAKPIYDRQPLRFYVDPGLPDVLSAPYRPNFVDEAIPTTYAGIWGDYFAIWAWNAHTKPVPGGRLTLPPPRRARVRLVAQSLVGLLPSLLALAGFVALARSSLRSPRRLLLCLLPVLALLGYLAFAVANPVVDGATIKTSFMLSALAGWAIAFGYALDRLGARSWRLCAALLVACALVDLTFIVYP